MTGFAPEELEGKPATEFVPPEERERVFQAIRTALEQGFAEVDGHLRRKDGQAIPYQFTGVSLKDERGQVIGLTGIGHDTTERQRSEEARIRTEKLYRRAIAAANGVPYLRDYRTETFAYLGEGIEKLTGYTAAELTLERWNSIVQEYQLRGELAGLATDEAVQKVRSGQVQHWQADCKIRTRDGQTRWLADASVEIMEEENRLGRSACSRTSPTG